MAAIRNLEELRAEIAGLEKEKLRKEEAIRSGVRHTIDSFRPLNIVKSLFGGIAGKMLSLADQGIISPPGGMLTNRLIQAAAAMGTSFLVRKIFRKKHS